MQPATIVENQVARVEVFRACLSDSKVDVLNCIGMPGMLTVIVRRRCVRKNMYVGFVFLLLYSLCVVISYEMTSKISKNPIGMFWQKQLGPARPFYLSVFNKSSQMKQAGHHLFGDSRSNGKSLPVAHVNGSVVPILAPVPSHRLCYDRALNTGFGDRLSVYLSVAAAAATVSSEVYTFWEAQPPIDGKCSVCDLSLDLVQQYVTWPTNLKVLTKQKYNEIAMNCSGSIQYNAQGLLKSELAFDGVYSLAWKTMKLPEPLPLLKRPDFQQSYRQVAKQFKITNVTMHQILVQQKYVLLHVRAGDYTGPPTHFNTFEVLCRLPKDMPIIVITDSDEYLPLIIPNQVIPILSPSTARFNSTNSSYLPIFRLPRPVDRYSALMHDFQLLLSATGIIQHAKNSWSSFSSVPAMMNAIPLLNTWITQSPETNSSKFVGLLEKFAENGGGPAELKSSHRREDTEHFLDMMRCEWDAFLLQKQRIVELEAIKTAERKNILRHTRNFTRAREVSSGVDKAPVSFCRLMYVLVIILLLLSNS
jgi:hypothetical protein